MKLMKLIRKKGKDLVREVMIEQIIDKANEISKENIELKEKLDVLTPSEIEDKKQTSYIG